tara:strand:- start:617 stop:1348 length:732 start_codon:yes stop_codon:yes gene_type:complete
MILIPAIDIKDKKCVRLFKGDFDKETIYSNSPKEVSLKWISAGASLIHLVDLDGALEGQSINFEVIKKILENKSCNFQIGGGIRNLNTIESYLSLGATRVILGTSVFTDEEFFEEACKNFSNNIAVGLDIKDNKIAIKGWNSELDIKLIDVLKRLEVLKVSLIILTSVDRDGTLQGFNKELIDEYLKISKIPVIISGGIKDNSDLNQIKLMDDERIYGAILGKSIYENKINLQDSIKEFENVS